MTNGGLCFLHVDRDCDGEDVSARVGLQLKGCPGAPECCLPMNMSCVNLILKCAACQIEKVRHSSEVT